MLKTNPPFTVRLCQPTDAAGVREVVEATYGASATPAAVFDWWSWSCPIAANGFMVAECRGRIVGVQPMQILPFVDGPRRAKGGVLTGVAVHPEFRRQGIFSALVRACEAEAWRQDAAFVTTMPNERSRPGFLKMGYTDLGRRRLLVRPLNLRALGNRAPGLRKLASAAGAVAGWTQSVLKRLPPDRGQLVKEVREVDDAIDGLEMLHAAHFPGLRLKRTAAWWRWRYLQSPGRTYRVFEIRDLQGRLEGLASSVSETRHGVLLAYLMDLAVASEAAMADLIRAVLMAAAGDGAVAVGVIVSAPAMVRALRRAGFWAVPSWVPVKKFYSVARFNPIHQPSLPQSWQRLGGWYQMPGDWDNL